MISYSACLPVILLSIMCIRSIHVVPNGRMSSFLIFFLLLTLGLLCSSSSCLRCKVRFLIWDLSNLLINVFIAINFPLRTVLAASHNILYVVFQLSFVPRKFLFPFWFLLWPIGGSGACCVLYMYLWSFQFSPVLLISDFTLLLSEKTVDMISVFLNSLRLVLWANLWSVL